MPKFAANLSMMFNEVPFLDRFAAAAEAGFRAVEFLFPYDYAPEEIEQRFSLCLLAALRVARHRSRSLHQSFEAPQLA